MKVQIKSILKYCLYFLLGIMFNSCTKEQPSSFQFEQYFKVFGQDFKNEAVGIVTIDDLHFIIGNVTEFSVEGNISKGIVICTDAYGNRKWEKIIERANAIELADIIALNDKSGIAIAGTYASDDSLYYNDFYFQQYSIDGDSMQAKIYNNKINEFGRCIGQFNNGSFLIVGEHTDSLIPTNRYKYSVALDSDGNLIKYGPYKNGTEPGQFVKSMVHDPISDECIVVGQFPNALDIASSFKVDKTGNIVNLSYYNIDGYFTDITLANNKFYVCGSTNDNELLIAQIYPNSSDYQWVKLVKNNTNVSLFNPSSLSVSDENKLIVVGTETKINPNEKNMGLILTDDIGNVIKYHTMGGDDDEIGTYGFQEGNSYVVLGTSNREQTSLITLLKTKIP